MSKEKEFKARKILRNAIENNGCDELCFEDSLWEQIIVDAMIEFAEHSNQKATSGEGQLPCMCGMCDTCRKPLSDESPAKDGEADEWSDINED